MSSSRENVFEWTFLANVFHETEADIIVSLLETNKIPTQKRYPGAGIFF